MTGLGRESASRPILGRQRRVAGRRKEHEIFEVSCLRSMMRTFDPCCAGPNVAVKPTIPAPTTVTCASAA